MVEQSGREQPPAVPTKRTRDAPVSADEDAAKVRFRPCLDPQPLFSGTPSRRSPDLQATPLGRIDRVAGARELTGRVQSDSSAKWRRVRIRLTAPPATLGTSLPNLNQARNWPGSGLSRAPIRHQLKWHCQDNFSGARSSPDGESHAAAADAASHSAMAADRKVRMVFRETRWRWKLKVL